MSVRNKFIVSIILFIFTIIVNLGFSYFFMRNPIEKIDNYMQLYKERGPKSHVISDEVGYEVIAGNVLKGKGFALPNASGIPKPTMVREPFYPWFLALVYLIFGHSFQAVFFVQKVLFGLTVVLVYSVISIALKNTYRYKIGFVVALLTALNVDFHYYTNLLMSEIFFTLLLMALAYVFIKSAKKNSLIGYGASGLLLGLCILTKAVMLPFIALGAVLIAYFSKKWFSKQLLVFICLCFAAIGPWIVRNYVIFKYPNITTRGGMVLWLRAKKLDYKNLDDLNKRAVYTFSRELGKVVYPGYTLDYNYILGKETIEHKERFGNMRNFITDEEIDKVCLKEATEKVKQHPFKYVFLSVYEIANLNSFCLNPVVDNETGRRIYKVMFLVSIPLFATGVFFIRKENLLLVPAAFIIYFNSVHSLISIDRGGMRYILPVVPFYTVFIILGAFFVLECLGIAKDKPGKADV